jgi:hypothetical protein
MFGRLTSRRAALGRRTKAVISVVSVTAVAIAAFGVAPSLAAWTHTEYDNGPASTLNCSSGTPFTTTSWAQEVAGQVGGVPLVPANLAGVSGISVDSGTPHSTVASGGAASGLSYLGSDAWSSDLQAGALNAITVGAALPLPLGQNTGVETQFARATATGVATGASGAITTAAGGLVALQSPSSSTPGVGSVGLASALSATVGQDLGSDVTQLANASLTIGALGSTTSIDSCNALWQGASAATAVVRNYVIAKLGLSFDSSLIGTATSVATGSVNTLTKASDTTLSAALNALQPLGDLTGTTLNSITSALGSALPGTAGSQVVSLGSPTTVQVGVTFDPSPALAVLDSTISAGPVSINLTTGEIDVDLGALGSLNGLAPNTDLLSTAVLSTLKSDIGTAVENFVSNTLEPALIATLNSATVVVNIASSVGLDLPGLGTVNVASLAVGITGSLGSFLAPGGSTGTPAVTVGLTSVATGPINTVLGILGLNINTLLAGITSTLNTTVLSGIVPTLGTSVLSPVLALATTAVGNTVDALTAALGSVITALGSVVAVLGDAVQLTANAEPDQPNSVGAPDTAPVGRYFESALEIGVLDTVDGSSALALYLGSSSVGPNVAN